MLRCPPSLSTLFVPPKAEGRGLVHWVNVQEKGWGSREGEGKVSADGEVVRCVFREREVTSALLARFPSRWLSFVLCCAFARVVLRSGSRAATL